MNYKSQNASQFAALPVPKWKRAPLPEQIFDRPVASYQTTIENENTKVSIEPLEVVFSNPVYEDYGHYLDQNGTHSKSLGPKFKSYVSGFSKTSHLIVSKARGFETPVVKIIYAFESENSNHLTEQLIIAETGSKMELILDYSASATNVSHFGRTTVVAKPGAFVKVVKVQRLPSDSYNFDLNMSVVEEGGHIEVVDLQIGAGYKAISNESELVGKHAKSEMKSAYYGENEDTLDLSYTMTHGAKQTESVILAKGALAGDASKVFRGNLFFSTGASESVGREQEYVTLLSPSVKSDSFPALMCSEDDVVGEHAASIGQIDTEKLFYLMSRGLSQVEAKRLLVKAAFEEIIGEISDSTLYSAVIDELDRRIG